MLYAPLTSSMRATCPAHLILHDIILIRLEICSRPLTSTKWKTEAQGSKLSPGAKIAEKKNLFIQIKKFQIQNHEERSVLLLGSEIVFYLQ
jgi:hypothetical protein